MHNLGVNEAGLPNRISEEIIETYAGILDAVAFGDFSDALVSLVRWLEIDLSGDMGNASGVYAHVGQPIELQIGS
jgi:hypothetical protein